MIKQGEFYNKIITAKSEKEIEFIYNQYFNNYLRNIKIQHPFNCDGYIESDEIKLLIEYKYDESSSQTQVAKILAQLIYYVKRFKADNDTIPNVLLIADANKCILLHSNSIIQYLIKDYDWTMSPSSAANNNELVNDIKENKKLNFTTIEINDDFEFNTLIDTIIKLNKVKKVEHSHNFYELYVNKIIDNSKVIMDKKEYLKREDVDTIVNFFISELDNIFDDLHNINLKRKYGSEIVNTLLKGEYTKGITIKQLIDIKGKPDHVEVKELKTKKKQIFIYGKYKTKGDKFIFGNGLLESYELNSEQNNE